MHWHWGSDSSKGSEHTIDGKEYPIEIHLVHVNTKYYDANGAPSDDTFSMPDGLAVLGIMYEVSTEDNANLTSILSKVMMNAILMLHTCGWSSYVPLKILSKVNEVAVEQRRKRKAGRAGPVELDMTLALETLLPEDTTQYYYYQVSVGFLEFTPFFF